MLSVDEIKGRVETALEGADVQVMDMTGSGDHFQIVVIAGLFEGKSLIERHRLVYAALGSDVGGAIHAAALKTMTPKEHAATPSG